ncbi:hypothetical protein [Paenibacillus arenosi]|uniref:Uncharacterized protein n=1 Tax=Paenibacillus arenosi TaxID=2774142 RepID=A0ABR9B0R7_9BACL|nr:hypothetical protein [Paenibacillus arenosi]MBD8499990.1 hypothetical protein [Paenibacillus arenosi]
MKSNFKQLVLIVIISLICSVVNFDSYLKGYLPSFSQALCSSLFIVYWLLHAFFMARKGMRFIKLSSLYWGIGASLFVCGYYAKLSIVFIPVTLLFAGPLYGLRYFINMPADILFTMVSFIFVYSVSVIGFLLGKHVNRLTDSRVNS